MSLPVVESNVFLCLPNDAYVPFLCLISNTSRPPSFLRNIYRIKTKKYILKKSNAVYLSDIAS